MAACVAVKDNEGNLGGAIYNEGKVTMFDTSNFFDNNSAVRDGTKRLYRVFPRQRTVRDVLKQFSGY